MVALPKRPQLQPDPRPETRNPKQHVLTELALHTVVPVGASLGLPLARLHFPRLRAHSLRKIVFEPLVGAELFILQHAATSRSCELILSAHPHWIHLRRHLEQLRDGAPLSRYMLTRRFDSSEH